MTHARFVKIKQVDINLSYILYQQLMHDERRGNEDSAQIWSLWKHLIHDLSSLDQDHSGPSSTREWGVILIPEIGEQAYRYGSK